MRSSHVQLLCSHHWGPIGDDWQGLVQVVAEVMWRQPDKSKGLVCPRKLKGGVQDEAHCRLKQARRGECLLQRFAEGLRSGSRVTRCRDAARLGGVNLAGA